jgi:hypothetical protein
MPDGSICTPEEQALFISSTGSSIVCLTRGDSIGLTLVAEAGIISMISVIGVFVLILVSILCLLIFSKLTALISIAQCYPEWNADSTSNRHIYGEPSLYNVMSVL